MFVSETYIKSLQESKENINHKIKFDIKNTLLFNIKE